MMDGNASQHRHGSARRSRSRDRRLMPAQGRGQGGSVVRDARGEPVRVSVSGRWTSEVDEHARGPRVIHVVTSNDRFARSACLCVIQAQVVTCRVSAYKSGFAFAAAAHGLRPSRGDGGRAGRAYKADVVCINNGSANRIRSGTQPSKKKPSAFVDGRLGVSKYKKMYKHMSNAHISYRYRPRCEKNGLGRRVPSGGTGDGIGCNDPLKTV